MEEPQVEEPEVVEESVVHKVKTVSDGSKCKHNFVDDWIDPENNKQHQQCNKCWSGRWRG